MVVYVHKIYFYLLNYTRSDGFYYGSAYSGLIMILIMRNVNLLQVL